MILFLLRAWIVFCFFDFVSWWKIIRNVLNASVVIVFALMHREKISIVFEINWNLILLWLKKNLFEFCSNWLDWKTHWNISNQKLLKNLFIWFKNWSMTTMIYRMTKFRQFFLTICRSNFDNFSFFSSIFFKNCWQFAKFLINFQMFFEIEYFFHSMKYFWSFYVKIVLISFLISFSYWKWNVFWINVVEFINFNNETWKIKCILMFKNKFNS